MVRGTTGFASRRNQPRTRSRNSVTDATALPYRVHLTPGTIILTVITFRGTLQAGDRGGAAVEIPTEALTALGTTARRPAVRVVINGVELPPTIAVYGGKSYIGVRQDIRAAAGVAHCEEIQ